MGMAAGFLSVGGSRPWDTKAISPRAASPAKSSQGSPSRDVGSVRDMHGVAALAAATTPSWRWVMLGILCVDICVSYIPYYTFVPIMKQSMQAYGVNENALNMLCIIYALVYVPGAFLTGPIVGAIGCRWTFVVATILNVFGCVVRCGPQFSSQILPVLAELGESSGVLFGHRVGNHSIAVSEVPLPDVAILSFSWLLLGQALCALGQPFLVNSTSEMAAEWFPAHERPTAAMVSNLMHYIGSSISFMLPPLIVDDVPHNLDVVEQQVFLLLHVQFWIALVSFLLTLFCYRPAPTDSISHRVGRVPVAFSTEVIEVFCCRDFWLVNWQFAIFVAIGHAFDAVEGSLLEHYGYSAALTAWTALSCSIASVLSTFLESAFITDPASYKVALFVSNGFTAAALVIGYVALHFQTHSFVFILAVGFLGLATPGWGCSCELASEVSFPAREATVGSLLEVFSNLAGVGAIVITQSLIDSGMGADVLILMAISALAGGAMLLGLTGRLHRSEAEAQEEENRRAAAGHFEGESGEGESLALDADLSHGSADPSKRVRTSICQAACVARRPRAMIVSGGKVALIALFGSCYILWLIASVWDARMSKLSGALTMDPGGSSMTVVLPTIGPLEVQAGSNGTGTSSKAPQQGSKHQRLPRLANGWIEPQSHLVHRCMKPGLLIQKLYRFRNAMRKANMTFTEWPCLKSSRSELEAAVREGLLPASALKAAGGKTRQWRRRSEELRIALMHLRVLRSISQGNAPGHIFDLSEVVNADFRTRRNQLLISLPRKTEYVNFNVERIAGTRIKFKSKSPASKWLQGKVFRMGVGLSPYTNTGLNNYVVTKRGAGRLLAIGRGYDTIGRFESFNEHMLNGVYGQSDFLGFTVQTNSLSLSCKGNARAHPSCV